MGKQKTQYSDALEHYDEEYFRDQTRDGDLRGILNAWKFEGFVRSGANLLDFGCGDGSLLAALGGGSGVEVNPHSAAVASARGYRVEATIDAYEDCSMNLIISNHCLEHVEDPLGVIREMRRVIRDDGMIAIVVPCHRADVAYRDSDRDFHLFSWSAANLGNITKLAGFDIFEVKEIRHRWPPKWRLINRYFGIGAINMASRIWARIERSLSQVICVARPTTSQ